MNVAKILPNFKKDKVGSVCGLHEGDSHHVEPPRGWSRNMFGTVIIYYVVKHANFWLSKRRTTKRCSMERLDSTCEIYHTSCLSLSIPSPHLTRRRLYHRWWTSCDGVPHVTWRYARLDVCACMVFCRLTRLGGLSSYTRARGRLMRGKDWRWTWFLWYLRLCFYNTLHVLEHCGARSGGGMLYPNIVLCRPACVT